MTSSFRTLIFALLVTVMFSVVASVARADMLPDGTPEEQYNYAIALTIDDGAEEAFKEFIVANPLHPKTIDARYWLGRTQFMAENFVSSKNTLEAFKRDYPADNRLVEIEIWLAKIAENESKLENSESELIGALKNLAEVSKNLVEKSKDPQEAETNVSPLGMSEINRLLNHISKCFVLPPNSGEELFEQVVDLDVELRRDGTVEKITFVDNGRLTTDRDYRIVALAARRAILDCAPLPLPPEKYLSWKVLPLGFNSTYMIR